MQTAGTVIEGTRAQALDLLLRRGRATVAELSDALGLTQGAVRRHLDRLRADGLIEIELLRQEMGRPLYVYRPSRAAEEAHAHYERLTERFVQEVGHLGPSDLTGLSGGTLLQAVFDGVARRVAEEHRAQVSGGDLQHRIKEVTEALRDEGILSDWAQTETGYALVNTACPYRRVADASHAACSMDRDVIERLLGAPVEQVGRLVDGETRCEYLVRFFEDDGAAGEAKAQTRDEER